eukprot:TRINITY_DN2361_c0_g1_i1.p1 TRINITY_DN2361_c0_g1~~TRINITY_DN2361_c0_g1_i1.p1  ORF type:complete len:506 (-),score=180.53 TRINITY_DN2361_c0_g1_i1:73-1590(-)
MVVPTLSIAADFNSNVYDCLIWVGADYKQCSNDAVISALTPVLAVDQGAQSAGCVVPVSLPCKRLVYSPTGPLDRDYDDHRRFAEAAANGIKKALAAGSKHPLLAVQGNLPNKSAEDAQLSALLGALAAVYVPLEMREAVKERAAKVSGLGWAGAKKVMEEAHAIEAGRVVARDIGGSDPERMAAPKVEVYVQEAFKGTNIKVEVMKGQEFFEKEYPCLAAVNRCANQVPRHDGRLIWLTYEGEGTVKKTVYVVGKGITYDTGGADIKAGGVMAGMSRDKCGAAATAGLMKTIAELQPKGVKVVAALCMVRNSVGANCYVADEIITSRAGVRIRVGNTDAEGRMAMVDVLCKAKELALSDPDPQLMTVATLTGHACLAVGDYSIIMDNGPARAAGTAIKVQEAGEKIGDMFEISTVRREDWDFVSDKSGEFVSVLQCNNAPSSRTPRGHQMPGAFMMAVSGLDKHMVSSKQPLKYSHLDIAGSAGDLPHPTTGAPVPALTKWLLG